jgi:hypothetical protein
MAMVAAGPRYGDGGCRAEAGQDADKHSDDDADEAVEEVHRFQHDAETIDDRCKKVHKIP